MKKIIIQSLSDIKNSAKQFLNITKEKKVFAFYGKMGVGKTTFIKHLCKALGTVDNITSPSFAIVNEYQTKNNYAIFHFDFYRIKNIKEAIDIGTEEYFYSGNICFIEWPEKIEDILPEETVIVEIVENQDGSREIKIK